MRAAKRGRAVVPPVGVTTLAEAGPIATVAILAGALAALSAGAGPVAEPAVRPAGWPASPLQSSADPLPVLSLDPPMTDGDEVRAWPAQAQPIPAARTSRASGHSPGLLAAKPPVVGRTVRMTVTAYCPCPICCGRWSGGGLTASGKPITSNRGRFVAADRSLPFGTQVKVPGYHGGAAVPVLDRGGLIKGNRLDLFMPTHAQARAWGRRNLEVVVIPPPPG